jgi:hypothetical protein
MDDQSTTASATGEPHDKAGSSQGAAPSQGAAAWTALIGLGLAFEMAGRFLGLRGNPSGLFFEPAPLLATASAGIVVVFASMRLMSSWAERDLAGFRRALLTLLLGSVMLAGSMLGKSIISQVFGVR